MKWLVANGAEPIGANYNSLVDDDWLKENDPGGDIDDHRALIFLSEYIRGKADLEPLYEGGETGVLANVPVALLMAISQQPGFINMIDLETLNLMQVSAPPRSEAPQDLLQSRDARAATRRQTQNVVSQGLSAHGVDSWHQAGFKGKGVRIGIIDARFYRV